MDGTTASTKIIGQVDLWRSFGFKDADAFEPGSLRDDFEPTKEEWLSKSTAVAEGEEPSVHDSWLDEVIGGSRSLEKVDLAIENSECLLEIPDNWDGLGALGYDERTLRRATSIARSLCWLAIDQYLRELRTPAISAADAGSIDLFWRMEGRYLLINVPRDPADAYTFYGESDGGESISGSSGKLREDLVVWLIRG